MLSHWAVQVKLLTSDRVRKKHGWVKSGEERKVYTVGDSKDYWQPPIHYTQQFARRHSCRPFRCPSYVAHPAILHCAIVIWITLGAIAYVFMSLFIFTLYLLYYSTRKTLFMTRGYVFDYYFEGARSQTVPTSSISSST